MKGCYASICFNINAQLEDYQRFRFMNTRVAHFKPDNLDMLSLLFPIECPKTKCTQSQYIAIVI